MKRRRGYGERTYSVSKVRDHLAIKEGKAKGRRVYPLASFIHEKI